MKIKTGDKTLDVTKPKVGEIVEAEQALGFSMDTGSGAQIAVMLFIGQSRENKQNGNHKTLDWIAGEVMKADITDFEVEDDESPPDGGAEAPEPSETSGPPASDSTE